MDEGIPDGVIIASCDEHAQLQVSFRFSLYVYHCACLEGYVAVAVRNHTSRT